MLASLEDLDAYGLAPRPEILSEVNDSSGCSVCGVEPLPASASYAETLDWLRRNNPAVAARIDSETTAELSEIESGMDAVHSAGHSHSSVDWRSLRTTHSYDSQLAPGYAIAAISLPAAMAGMDPGQQDFFVNTLLAALCGFCATRPAEGENLLLHSYVNQWADGNVEVARRQPSWSEVERVASIATTAARASVRHA
jgi:hypothetical protein